MQLLVCVYSLGATDTSGLCTALGPGFVPTTIDSGSVYGGFADIDPSSFWGVAFFFFGVVIALWLTGWVIGELFQLFTKGK